jgi:hypothetical protein
MRATEHLLPLTLLSALALPALAPAPALAQDDDAEVDDDSSFLGVDKHTCQDPPIRLTRPNDAWQFVDLAKVYAQRGGAGNLKFQLWYGAARASIYVRAFKLSPSAKLPELDGLVDGGVAELTKALQEAKVTAKKGAKVGKRPAALYAMEGKAPHPRRRTELRTVFITRVVCTRKEDNTVLVIQLEHSDSSRASALGKDLKKLLKKAKF